MRRIEFLKAIVGGVCGLPNSIGWSSRTPKPKTWTLNHCWIAGFAYHDGPGMVEQLRAGVRLDVKEEFNNPHDRHAVALYLGSCHLGYVPRAENRHLARLIRQGARLESRILAVHPDHDAWDKVRVEINLLSDVTK
jgi:hypothetical protein